MSLKISPISKENIDDLNILLSEYQEFYEAKPDPNHNLKFLENFIESNEGIFFIAYKHEKAIGYVSLYFSYSSVSAKRIAILNDLYVTEASRKCGFGKELIDHAIDIGIDQVRWCTRIDNVKAQKLYSKYEAVKTDWFHYDLHNKA